MSKALLIVLALPLALAGCTASRSERPPPPGVGGRIVTNAALLPPIGDPGMVVATDVAFARMARIEGTWTAFRRYAAPDAVRDAPGGWTLASEALAGLADPAEPLEWAPTTAWSSCDGSLAVTFGRFKVPGGMVGSYVTIWQLQPSGEYRWVYDTGAFDDPQPRPVEDRARSSDDIYVEGLDMIDGRVADCSRNGEILPPIPPLTLGESDSRGGTSADGTLRWTSYLFADGRRQVNVDWVREGAVQLALELAIPAG